MEYVWNEIKEILTEFQGMIGAIVGSLSTLIVSKLLRNWGNINCHTFNFDVTYRRMEDRTGDIVSCEKRQAERAIIKFDIDFFNEKETPTAIRKLKFGFQIKSESVTYFEIDDRETRRSSGHMINYDELPMVNLPPKKLIHKKARVFIGEEEIENFLNCNSLFLCGTFPDGSEFKHRIERINQ